MTSVDMRLPQGGIASPWTTASRAPRGVWTGFCDRNSRRPARPDPSALVDDRVAALRAYHASTGIERAEPDARGSTARSWRACSPWPSGGGHFVYSAIHSGERPASGAGPDRRPGGTQVSTTRPRSTTAWWPTCSPTSRPRVLTWRPCRRRATPARRVRSAAACARPRPRLPAPHGAGIRHGTGNECEDRWLRFYQKVATARSTRTRSRCCRRARSSSCRELASASGRATPTGDRRGGAHPELWG